MSSRSKLKRYILGALALLLVGAAAPTYVYFLRFQTDVDGNWQSITNLNSIQATGTVYFGTIAGSATNQFGPGQTATNYTSWQGIQIAPSSNQTNYWFDFGIPNSYGSVIYQTVVATNNVNFIGLTNSRRWGLVSINVLASGGNRLVSFPTNLPHLTTNGLTPLGTAWSITVNSGNELRITVQSNINNVSTIWCVFGQ